MRVALLHGFAGDPHVWDDVVIAGVERVAIAYPPVAATWDAAIAAIAPRVAGCDALVGYSLGARIALGLPVPRKVLISVNPGIDDAARAGRREGDAAWARVLREQGIAAFVDAWEAQPLFATQARVDPVRRAGRRARRLELDAEELARSLEVLGLAEMPDYRDAIDERCAFVVGAEDAKYVALAQQHARGGEVAVIAACGHDPTLEQPVELGRVLARLLA